MRGEDLKTTLKVRGKIDHFKWERFGEGGRAAALCPMVLCRAASFQKGLLCAVKAVRALRTPLTLVCGCVQLQNEEEPGEAVPVVNDAPPPYSSISAESTGTVTWGKGSALTHCPPPPAARIRIDPHSPLVLVV